MPILRSMEGKYYDLSDAQATEYEVPRDKLKELFEKAGVPVKQGAEGQAPQSQQGAPSGAPKGQGAPPPSAPVVVHVYAAPQGQSGPPPQQQAPEQHGEHAPAAEGEGEVDPYWYTWFRNFVYRPWGNWGNWGNGWGNW